MWPVWDGGNELRAAVRECTAVAVWARPALAQAVTGGTVGVEQAAVIGDTLAALPTDLGPAHGGQG